MESKAKGRWTSGRSRTNESNNRSGTSKGLVRFADRFARLEMYIGPTVPFTNQTQRAKHFRKHGHEFGAVDEFAYEQMADAFMSQPMHPNLYECVNPTGTRDRNRLDAITRCFGVAYNITVIRTMHIRDAYAIQHWGGPHGFVNKKCSEVFI